LFHGVIDANEYAIRNYTKKHVLRDEFEGIIAQLAKHGQPLTMDDVIELSEAKKPFPPRSFAITFDDGFANNHDIAAPILRDYNVPATFYVTTGFIENNLMSWIDQIEYCFELTQSGNVQFPWNDSPRVLRSVIDKMSLLDEIRYQVKRDVDVNVDSLVSEIFSQCGVAETKSSNDPLDQKMTWSQVASLDSDGLFSIGGHTHTHRVMSFLDETELEEEISLSLSLLRDNAGVGSRHYSYPEGLAHCYNNKVIAALTRHGVDCCPSAERGLNYQGENLFRLKRIMVG
jgi:peptidoglycan/xylan/chitin deacetylase (PgdA/CDA1 family)